MKTITFPAADRRRDAQGTPPAMTATVYAAIRSTEGRRWIDTNTLALLAEDARRKADDTDRAIPQWARAHPCAEIAQCILNLAPTR